MDLNATISLNHKPHRTQEHNSESGSPYWLLSVHLKPTMTQGFCPLRCANTVQWFSQSINTEMGRFWVQKELMDMAIP